MFCKIGAKTRQRITPGWHKCGLTENVRQLSVLVLAFAPDGMLSAKTYNLYSKLKINFSKPGWTERYYPHFANL
jgi:hypothetical protein